MSRRDVSRHGETRRGTGRGARGGRGVRREGRRDQHRTLTRQVTEESLLQAIMVGDCRNVCHALEAGISPSVMNRSGHSALHLAATKGYIEIVRILLQFGVDVTQNEGSAIIAVSGMCSKAAHQILDLFIATETLSCNAKYATEAICEASAHGNRYGVEALLLLGVNPYGQAFEGTCLTLHEAIGAGYGRLLLPTLLSAIRDADLPIDEIDGEERTALHIAAASGDLFSVKLLLHAGASVDVYDIHGVPPHHIARVCGESQVADFLAAYSAAQEEDIEFIEGIQLMSHDNANLQGRRGRSLREQRTCWNMDRCTLEPEVVDEPNAWRPWEEDIAALLLS